MTLAVIAAFVVPVAAYAPQNNLFLDLTGGRVYHHGTFLMLEELQELVASQAEPVDNVVVTVDESSEVVMMLGIRDYVAQVSQANVIFVFPKTKDHSGEIQQAGPRVFTLDRSPFFEPLSNQEYYTEQALWEFNQPMPEETRGITVLMDHLNRNFYMRGEEVHWSAPFTYLLEDFKMPPQESEENSEENAGENAETDTDAESNENEAPYLRIKISDNTTAGELLAYERIIEWYCVDRNLQINYAYFSPDSRVALASAFNINPAYLDDLEIATVNYKKTDEYSVAANYWDYSDIEDMKTQIGYYIHTGERNHHRGRVIVNFTVCIDGTVKDIEQVFGIKSTGELVKQALETAPPCWSQARDLNGDPVNMRFSFEYRIR